MQKDLTHLLILVLLILFNVSYAQDADSLRQSQPKIGLVLSGGGANGFAHIGVLKVLEEVGIRPDYITGTSMGAIIGALYSLGYSADQLEAIVKQADWDLLFSDKISFREIPIFDKNDYPGYSLKMSFIHGLQPSLPSGMIQGQQIQALFSKLVWQSNVYPEFDAFPIPYRCLATDIISGKAVVLKDGDLAEAMRASMAIPTIFTPIEKDSMLLVDGGVVKNFPVQECKDMGADIVIGVYTGFSEHPKKEDLTSMVKILARTSAFPGIVQSKEEAKKTDVYISPNLSKFGPDNFHKAANIIQAGEKAAQDSLIMRKLQNIASGIRHQNSNLAFLHRKTLWIDRIQVEGCKLTNSQTIINISGLRTKRGISAKEIYEATHKIYASWQFKKVSYHIKKTPKERILIFQVDEKNRATLNIGLHYDNSYGPNALLKASYDNLFIKSTKASIQFSISKNPRALLRYRFYPSKKRQLEISLNSYLQLSKMPDIIKEENLVYSLGHYVYTFADFNLRLSWSPIKNLMLEASAGKQLDNIVLKDGMEIYYNTNTVDFNYSFYQFRLHINNLNDPYFPSKGIYLDATYKYTFDVHTNQSDTSYLAKTQTNNNSIFTLKYQQYFLIANQFSIIPELSFGTMEMASFITKKFFLGGINYSLRPNTFNFGGMRTNYIATDNFLMAGLGGQYRMYKKFYLQFGMEYLFIANYADYELEDENLKFGNNGFISWKAGLGYQSKFGPIRFILSKSPDRKEFVWSMNIGVPF